MNFSFSSLLKVVAATIFRFTLFFITVEPHAFADKEKEGDQSYLFGEFGGLRDLLKNQGLTVESALTLDTVGNVSGGVNQKSVFLGNYDLTATVDTKKIGLWSGGTFFTYVLANFGEAPSQSIGDNQVSDNIEAPESIKLYEAWYDQSFSGDIGSFRVGLYDYNSEYVLLNFAQGFINSSFGLTPEIAQVGPSNFPTTSLAARLKANLVKNAYILASVFDGVPGDPDNERGTHIKFGDDDGLFYGLEIGREGGSGSDYWKTAAGYWYHTAEFEDYNGTKQNNNAGMYYIGEVKLFCEDDVEQGLGAFIQTGFASANRNQINQYYGIGLSYTGLFDNRDSDIFSIGVANAVNSNSFVNLDDGNKRVESAIEVNYKVQVTPYFAIVPDLQYIINPGTTADIDNALVLGLRTEILM